MAEYYTVAAKGVPGNDDYGTMSAWLLFAKVGGCYIRVLYRRNMYCMLWLMVNV
jgi:putative alpha-1,2-mannosidase